MYDLNLTIIKLLSVVEFNHKKKKNSDLHKIVKALKITGWDLGSLDLNELGLPQIHAQNGHLP